MKYTLLKTATVLAIAALSSQAYADPKISGRVVGSITPQNFTDKTTNLTQNTETTTSKRDRTLFQTDARLRFHGKEGLSDKLDFVYSLDYQLAIDAQREPANFTSRDTYIGLEHKDFGKVHFGRLLHRDYFARVLPDASIYFAGDTPWHSYSDRSNNVISLHSPSFGPDKKVNAVVNYGISEKSSESESYSGNINYNGDKLGLAAGFRSSKGFDTVTAATTYKITDNTKVGAAINQAKYAGRGTESATLVSFNQKLANDMTFFTHFGVADNYHGYKDGKKTNLTAGVYKTIKKDGGTIEIFGSGNYANTTSFSVASEDKDATKKGDLVRTESKGALLEAGIGYFF